MLDSYPVGGMVHNVAIRTKLNTNNTTMIYWANFFFVSSLLTSGDGVVEVFCCSMRNIIGAILFAPITKSEAIGNSIANVIGEG